MSNILTNRWFQAIAATLVLVAGFFTYQSNTVVVEDDTTIQVDGTEIVTTEKVVNETTNSESVEPTVADKNITEDTTTVTQ
jgi:hypothetical protein